MSKQLKNLFKQTQLFSTSNIENLRKLDKYLKLEIIDRFNLQQIYDNISSKMDILLADDILSRYNISGLKTYQLAYDLNISTIYETLILIDEHRKLEYVISRYDKSQKNIDFLEVFKLKKKMLNKSMCYNLDYNIELFLHNIMVELNNPKSYVMAMKNILSENIKYHFDYFVNMYMYFKSQKKNNIIHMITYQSKFIDRKYLIEKIKNKNVLTPIIIEQNNDEEVQEDVDQEDDTDDEIFDSTNDIDYDESDEVL